MTLADFNYDRNKSITYTFNQIAPKEVDQSVVVVVKLGNKATAATAFKVPPVFKVTSVALNKKSTNVNVGASETLVATVNPPMAKDKTVTWNSSNTAVATVEQDGTVKGVSKGKATITMTTRNGSKRATCIVMVNQPITSVSLNKSITTINAGTSENLVATTNPTTAGNKIVGWRTSDETVATVDAKGKVKGVSEGVATITVITLDGGHMATCIVTVTMPVKGITLNKKSNTIAVGSSDQLTASINPTNATNMNVNWASSNKAVAIALKYLYLQSCKVNLTHIIN